MRNKLLTNRAEAGKQLAKQLLRYQSQPNTLVLALPRGGVPVAFEIAKKLQLPLDVYLVRKLAVPWNKEFAMGAIAHDGEVTLDAGLLKTLAIPPEQVAAIVAAEKNELLRCSRLYRTNQSLPLVAQKTIILVDDGLATGSTMYSAVISLKKMLPARMVIAIPVGEKTVVDKLRNQVDEVICLLSPWQFYSVGNCYENFSQIEDSEVVKLLEQAKACGSNRIVNEKQENLSPK